MNTDPNTIRTWPDLANAFVTHYAYNTYILFSRRKLGFVKQGPTESFTDFITRWRAQAAQVQKRPSEEDQIAMVWQSLNPFDTNRLTLTQNPTFNSLVCAGCQIEDALAARRSLPLSTPLQSKGSSNNKISRKSLPRPLRLKQRWIQLERRRWTKPTRGRQHSHFQIKTNPSFLRRLRQLGLPNKIIGRLSRPNSNNRGKCPISKVSEGQGQRQARRQDRPLGEFTPLPLPMSKLMGGLVQKGMLTLLEPKPTPNPLPWGYDPNAICHYHQSRGHWTDKCWNLRHAIQDFFDTKQFVLPPAPVTAAQPNLNNNPLPAHPVQPG